jgi:hypothetical protein
VIITTTHDGIVADPKIIVVSPVKMIDVAFCA